MSSALLPIVVAALRAVRRGWIPTWDTAYPALRAWDVFTRHPPLLGDRSMASGYRDIATNHPGPLEAQALAVWVRLLGLPAGTVVGIAVVNAVCVLGVAWLAGRRGGLGATVLAMAALAGLAWSMGSEMLFDPWPSHAVLYPFALYVVAAWSVADRDPVALPVLVVAGSYVLQTHLSYTVLVPGIALAALALLVARTRTAEGAGRGGLRRWGVLAGGLGALCWALPVYEQLHRPPGNLRSLIDTAGAVPSSLSWSTAVRLLAGTVALPPWWLPPSFRSPAVDAIGRGVALAPALLGLAALVALLAAGLVRARRRGRSAVASGLVLALVMLPLALFTMTNAPLGVGIVIDYCRFLWIVSAFTGVLLALAAADEVRRRRPGPTGGRVLAPVLVALVAAIAGGAALPYAAHSTPAAGWSIDATGALAADVVPTVEGLDGPVVVEQVPPFGYAGWVGPGLMVELHEAGVPFVVDDPVLEGQLGPWRADDGSSVARLTVAAGTLDGPVAPPSPTARVVARSAGLGAAERHEHRRLHDELRAVLAHTGGLPVRDELPDSPDVPAMAGTLRRMVAEIDDLGDDPDTLLASPVLVQLVNGVDVTFGGIDEVVDPDLVPTDDLVRYARLETWRHERAVVVYLDDP
jgi:hypothetical protein